MTKCKCCGKDKTLEVCNDCNELYFSKWISEDNGKDTYLRLERKLDDLNNKMITLQRAFNIILAKKYKIKTVSEEGELF